LTRGVSCSLAWSDFFSRQTQLRQLAAQHARTCFHLLLVESAFTQFRKRKIGLLLDLGPDEFGATLQCPLWSVDVGVRSDLASGTHSMQPFLDCRQADSKGSGDRRLCLIAGFSCTNHALSEVWTIWIHARKSNPF
jgi:hypothetical protein